MATIGEDGGRGPGRRRPPANPFGLPPAIARERRLHARVHAYWESLRRGRPLPAVRDLDPACMADGAAQTLVVEIVGGDAPPRFRFVGRALASEAGIGVDEGERVPGGSLLGEMARQVPRVAAAAHPHRFEAEYVDAAGVPTLYRGALLPMTGEGDDVRFVYGVVNWRRIATGDLGADVRAAVTAALAEPAAPVDAPACAWGSVADPAPPLPPPTPEQRLAAARTWAALAEDAGQGEAALHKAAAALFDLVCAAPAAFPLAPARLAGLVLGPAARWPARRRLLAAIAWGRRLRLAPGQLAPMLATVAGGLETVVRTERAARRDERRGRREPPASCAMRLTAFEEPTAAVPALAQAG